jgi:transposase
MLSMDGIALTEADVDDALTTDRKSSRSQRIEIITRGERRRNWSMDQKREIVIASLQPGARAGEVAREYGINSGLLYTWRRQMLEGQLGKMVQPPPSFARVEIAKTAQPPSMPPTTPTQSAQSALKPLGPMSAAAGSLVATGQIEITLPSGISVRVDADVDGRALRRVLAALEAR